MVYVIAGGVAVAAIAYGVYTVAQKTGKIHQQEAEHAGADAGT